MMDRSIVLSRWNDERFEQRKDDTRHDVNRCHSSNAREMTCRLQAILGDLRERKAGTGLGVFRAPIVAVRASWRLWVLPGGAPHAVGFADHDVFSRTKSAKTPIKGA